MLLGLTSCVYVCVFFFKQKTADEMRISDWSSDVCSSDLVRKKHGFSQGLIDDLKAHRLQITKAHLAEDFEAAFDVALYSLCTDILHLGYRADPLDLRAVQVQARSSLGDLKDPPAARDRTSTRLNSSNSCATRMPSSA